MTDCLNNKHKNANKLRIIKNANKLRSSKFKLLRNNRFITVNFRNSIFIFIVMMILHIIFNYLAVRAVCLRTLNEPRFIQVIDTYLRKEIVANPCEVNRSEPIIFYQLGPNLLGK